MITGTIVPIAEDDPRLGTDAARTAKETSRAAGRDGWLATRQRPAGPHVLHEADRFNPGGVVMPHRRGATSEGGVGRITAD